MTQVPEYSPSPPSSIGSSPPHYSSETYTSSSPRRRIIMPPSSYVPTPDAPRLAHRPLPPSSTTDNDFPTPPPTKGDFVSAAVRTHEHHQRIIHALRQHDMQEANRKYCEAIGLETMLITPTHARSISGSSSTLGRNVYTRSVMADETITLISRPSEVVAEGSGAKEGDIEVKEDTEGDEAEAVVPVAAKKRNKKKNKTKKKGKKGVDGCVGAEGDADAAKLDMALQAEEGRVGVIGDASEDDGKKEGKSGFSLADDTHSRDCKCSHPATPMAQHQSSLLASPARVADTPPSASTGTPYLLMDGATPSRITVKLPVALPAPLRVASPTHTPVLPTEGASEPLRITPPDLSVNIPAIDASTYPPKSPKLVTPADDAIPTLPSINVSPPAAQGDVSPTPTETDLDADVLEESEKTLAATARLLEERRSTSSMDDDITPAQLAQLTSFAPRTVIVEHHPSIIDSQTTAEPTSFSPPLSLSTLNPPSGIIGIPIPTSQLISLLPPNRHLSPAPTLPGSPLRNEVLPFSPLPEDCKTAKAWSLYFSDTDKARAPLRRACLNAAAAAGITIPSAVAYQDNLVPIFTADNLVDLFGKWKALRRQIANATRRPIEAPHTEMRLGEMGLGLHHMSEDNNFHFFREGVKPMWEDPACAKGGKFMFAGNGGLMDSIFFDFVLLLLTDSLSFSCPIPPDSYSEVVGISIARRGNNTRLEVWLGGPTPPDLAWVKKVQDAFVLETKGGREEARGEKVFDYQPFHASAGFSRRGGGAAARSSNELGVGGVMMSRTNSAGGLGGGSASGIGGLMMGRTNSAGGGPGRMMGPAGGQMNGQMSRGAIGQPGQGPAMAMGPGLGMMRSQLGMGRSMSMGM